jgi:acyl carrier protein
MAPSIFVAVDQFPRTTTGKVDRKKLPAPWSDAPLQEHGTGEPRTYVEQELVEAWGRLLGGGSVKITDDFFVSGGHSLMAIQLVSRLNEQFAIDLPLDAVFRFPTIQRLASQVEAFILKSSDPEGILAALENLRAENEEKVETQRV